MSCYSPQPACRTHLRRSRPGLQLHVGALLCLFALLFSLVAPMVPMWEVGAGQERVASRLFSTLSRLYSPETSAVLATPEGMAQSLPHDAMLCPVCQGLSRLRHWLLPPVYALVAPTASNWQAPQTVSFFAVYFLHRHTPRAPPVLS
jgi:hypothetical protein